MNREGKLDLKNSDLLHFPPITPLPDDVMQSMHDKLEATKIAVGRVVGMGAGMATDPGKDEPA